MEEHDYKDTIKAITYAEDENETAEDAARRRDAEIGYEALALSSCMGALGMEQEYAELLQLQLTQEVLYNDRENDGTDNNLSADDDE